MEAFLRVWNEQKLESLWPYKAGVTQKPGDCELKAVRTKPSSRLPLGHTHVPRSWVMTSKTDGYYGKWRPCTATRQTHKRISAKEIRVLVRLRLPEEVCYTCSYTISCWFWQHSRKSRSQNGRSLWGRHGDASMPATLHAVTEGVLSYWQGAAAQGLFAQQLQPAWRLPNLSTGAVWTNTPTSHAHKPHLTCGHVSFFLSSPFSNHHLLGKFQLVTFRVARQILDPLFVQSTVLVRLLPP